MYKHLYSRFLGAQKKRFHFACHSHHYWPDVTRDAQLQYWDDSCEHVDDKWNYLFSKKIPQAQRLIAQQLNLTHSAQIVFATSTHELSYRLLSTLDRQKPIHILTTDSEFYSFERQLNRFAENPEVRVVKVPTLPIADFEERFCAELKKQRWSLVFLSHVFFNSGLTCNFKKIVQQIDLKELHRDTITVIDGYHGFMAVPTDLSEISEQIFYLSGSYKYAQGGEGCCFMTVPKNSKLRPEYTGWFAELEHLTQVGSEVGYPAGALRFAGSTMDFTPLYRLIATLEMYDREGINVDQIHNHIQICQKNFLLRLDELQHPFICRQNLMANTEAKPHGHFLTFQLQSVEQCQQISRKLKENNIITDSRGSRLRFGFGLYHDGDYRNLSLPN